MTFYTIGHGARSTAELVAILRESAIATLVDVRAFPASKRNPQFAREPLSAALEEFGIRYDWQGRALGGYRKVPYPEHMKTETDPENCHRAHIADWLVKRGHRVVHLLAPGRSREHVLHPQEELWRED